MSSFRSATFEEQGTTSKRVGGEAIGTPHRIANGGEIWQSAPTPQIAKSITIPAQGTEAQLAACYAEWGQRGTLSWGVGGTSLTPQTADARLMGIAEGDRLKQGNVIKWSMTFKVY